MTAGSPGCPESKGVKLARMEKYTMFMDWKNQCSENEYTTQSLVF